MNRPALKARSRASMLWSRPGVLMVGMVYWLIRLVIEWFAGIDVYVLQDGGFALSVDLSDPRGVIFIIVAAVIGLLSYVLNAGYNYNYPLRVARNEAAGIGRLFELAEHKGRFVLLPLVVNIITALPMLPALCLAALNISRRRGYLGALINEFYQSFVAGASAVSLQAMAQDIVATVLPTTVWILLCLGGVVSVFLSLTYAQTIFLAIDAPHLGFVECLRRSRVLMRGRRGEYLVMQISFILWYFPVALGMGMLVQPSAGVIGMIGMLVSGLAMLMFLWVSCYRNVTCANYYSLISGQLPRKNTPPPGVRLVDLASVMRPWSPGEDDEDEQPPEEEAAPEEPDDEDARRKLIDEMWKR